MQYQVGEVMAGRGTETTEGDRRAGGQGGAIERLNRFLTRADPNRLATPAGEQVVDIYRRAYVNGGLGAADARRAHLLWFTENLSSAPGLLMIAIPSILLFALTISGIASPPVSVWTAVLFSTAADVALSALWYATLGARMHAQGVPLALRTLTAFVALTLCLAVGHELLHRLAPHLFVGIEIYLPLLLPFQLMVFLVYHFAFDVHIDYGLVTRRWTDTPLQRLLPFDKRGKLVFLRASDHYVIVRTSKGEHELRMRFADALERLGSARGLQVHRSFWVAQDYL